MPLRSTIVLIMAVGVPSMAQVSGVVVDRGTGRAVGGARVMLQGTGVFVLTEADGQFELAAPAREWATIAAAKKGYYNGSKFVSAPASDLTVEIESVPQMDNPDYTPLEPKECGECHPDQVKQWTGSPMSEAGVNTWMYDIYSGDGTDGGDGGFVYLRDSAYAGSNPESECAACHQPESWIAEPHTAVSPVTDLSPAAVHGISCEVCHKIAHIDESRKNYPGIYPGIVTWSRPEEESHQVQYGALGDAAYGLYPFKMRASYQPQLTAAMCGSCHQDKNDPDEDGNFEDEHGVIAEPTYLEWLNSPYGDPESPHFATCVDCHMPSYGATIFCKFQDFIPPERDPDTIRHHRIEGTTPQFLDNSVSLELSGEVVDNLLDVEVAVINDKTGHHMPGGISIRNVILLVEAWRAADGEPFLHVGTQTVHELGGVGDPAQGYYAGLPGKLFAKVAHDADGHGPVFFTEATGVLLDNRIPALAEDVSTYTFRIPPGAGELRVRARLIYRRSFRYLVDEKGWTLDGHGRPLADIQPPHFGHVMEEAEWSSTGATLASTADLLPHRSSLYQSFPNPLNPFNPTTTIGFDLRRESQVALRVFDLLGQEVRTLLDSRLDAGYHTAPWDGTDSQGRELGSGVYIYRLQTGPAVHTMRLVLVR